MPQLLNSFHQQRPSRVHLTHPLHTNVGRLCRFLVCHPIQSFERHEAVKTHDYFNKSFTTQPSKLRPWKTSSVLQQVKDRGQALICPTDARANVFFQMAENPLWKVPSEVRALIFAQSFLHWNYDNEFEAIMDGIFSSSSHHNDKSKPVPSLLAALRVVPNLYSEALEVFYEVNTFSLSKQTYVGFNNLRVDTIKLIQNLYIVITSVLLSLSYSRHSERCLKMHYFHDNVVWSWSWHDSSTKCRKPWIMHWLRS